MPPSRHDEYGAASSPRRRDGGGSSSGIGESGGIRSTARYDAVRRAWLFQILISPSCADSGERRQHRRVAVDKLQVVNEKGERPEAGEGGCRKLKYSRDRLVCSIMISNLTPKCDYISAQIVCFGE